MFDWGEEFLQTRRNDTTVPKLFPHKDSTLENDSQPHGNAAQTDSDITPRPPRPSASSSWYLTSRSILYGLQPFIWIS